MPDPVRLDQFHVSLLLSANATPADAEAARRALDDPLFLDALRDAVRRILDADPALSVLVPELSL